MSAWISVDERLPEIKKPVLMRVECGSHFNIEEGYFKGGVAWVNCWCANRGKHTYPITHWQPLPPPPIITVDN